MSGQMITTMVKLVYKQVNKKHRQFYDNFTQFLADDETQQQNRSSGQPLQSAQFLFPSCLCSAIVPIVDLLDDSVLTPDGVAVCDLANQVTNLLLFARHFKKKLNF
jgi:hypothetical protein